VHASGLQQTIARAAAVSLLGGLIIGGAQAESQPLIALLSVVAYPT
jgi:hypothetical protein